jgi:hypothetical protein
MEMGIAGHPVTGRLHPCFFRGGYDHGRDPARPPRTSSLPRATIARAVHLTLTTHRLIMRSDGEITGRDLVDTGCGVLFGLPFALVGLFVTDAVLTQLRQGAWRDALVGSFYALMFSAVGLGIISLSLRGPVKVPTALRASAPGEPWRWRQDWATGRIVSADRQDLRSAWFFAIFWNVVGSYLYFMLPGEVRSGNWPALVGLIIPLVGISLLVRAVKTTLRWRRFEGSTLELAESPAMIGGRLVGRITSERLPVGATSIKLRLVCLRLEKHHRSTSERVIWEAEKTLTDYPIHFSGGIPVEFDIPADCEPTFADRFSDSEIRWMLYATAEVPGVDYAPRFDVPVFRTSAPTLASAEAPLPRRR